MSWQRSKVNFLVISASLLAAELGAVTVPAPSPLAAHGVGEYGFVATIVPQPMDAIAAELPSALLAERDDFLAAAGPAWTFYVDRRSGAVALAEGQGLRWIDSPADDAAPALTARAMAFVASYPSFFQAPAAQLALDPQGARRFGERGQFWSLAFHQVLGGVPVEGSKVVFRVSHGNLVQFGAERVLPAALQLDTISPALSAAAARAELDHHLGGFLPTDTLREDGRLAWFALGHADALARPVGEGWEPLLAYVFSFRRAGDLGTWQALVDAQTGAIRRFVDLNRYASALLRGSVYTLSNTGSLQAAVPGDIPEVAVTIPNARLNFAGGTCSGDDCFSNMAGAFSYPPGAVSATTTLQGKYFNVADECGAVAASGLAPGGLDLGTSDPNGLGTNTDCFAATRNSPPDATPNTGGPGDTHAARNTFYHMNLINQKGRAYLPDNQWLRGVDGPNGAMLINTNAPPACNALWSGNDTGFVFMKVTQALFCNNTGEIPDIFLHEWGHGLDENDATGAASEGSTGEAMGDTFALLQGQHSCLGPGTGLQDPTAPNWGDTAGYGSATVGSKSRLCSGFREWDYTRMCNRGAEAISECAAARDTDAPNGSRSGPLPDLFTASETGTPARWNHMIQNAALGADGQSNTYDCGVPGATSCSGPLNHECHCESLIASQANWDLAKALIATEFAGSAYNEPQGPAEVSGWQYLDRLWYLSRDLSTSAYTATGANPAGTTSGCAATTWFSTYRFVDDDNGNLADGTPHADLIFSAFDLHAIACGGAADAANQRTGCPAPIVAPAVGTCGTDAPVHLQWTASAGASEYRVLRNTLGCGFGFTPVGTGIQSSPGSLFFEDTEVAPGVPYFYSVQPVGSNASCYGFASNCVQVTPTVCAATEVTAPQNVAAVPAGSGEAAVSWDAVAQPVEAYKVQRKPGTCAEPGTFSTIGIVAAPDTVFLDTGLQGSTPVSYQVLAAEAACATCTSAPSACVTVTPIGPCTLAPNFAGVESVIAADEGSCLLTVNWDAGTPVCGSQLTYSVYRSTDPDFATGPANQIATGWTALTYDDTAVTGGTRYFYAVRATDDEGNTDANTKKASDIPAGSYAPGTFADDAGDTPPARFFRSPTPGNQWSVRANDGTANASKVYVTSAGGGPPTSTCESLEGPTVFLGANPTLTFRSRISLYLNDGADGGILEVATEAGGYTDWTKLETVDYPGVFTPSLGGTNACGGAGFAAGQRGFVGNSNVLYVDYTAALLDYANQRVRLRFRFGSNGDAAHPSHGWFIDDLEITGAQVPGACTGNRLPLAVDDAFSIDEDAPATALDVLGNDSDADDDPLTIVGVSDPAHGTATTDGATVEYQPDPDYDGTDTFAYTVTDGIAGPDSAVVTITLNPINDAPLAVDDAYSTDRAISLIVPAPGVLSNDTDVDSGTLTPSIADQPDHGTVTLNTDGSFSYLPALCYDGTDSFTYTLSDGIAPPDTATVEITIDNPTAASCFYTVTPCRLYDSRNQDGALADATPRQIPIAGLCTVPASARSVSLNVTMVQGSNPGSFNLYPVLGSPTDTPVIHFRANQTRANNTVLMLGAGGVLFGEAALEGGGQVHLVVDVNGWFE